MGLDTQQPLLPYAKDDVQKPLSQVSLFKGQILLNPTISKINFCAYLAFSVFISFIVFPISLLQLPLLGIVYGLDTKEKANVTSLTSLIMVGIKCFALPLVGYISDKYGRRILIILGIFLISSSVVIMPILPNIYPCYVIVTLVLDIGFLVTMSAPLLADYIDYETKGRVAGVMAVLGYSTSSISTFIMEKIDLKDNITLKFYELAAIALILGFIIILGLKGGAYHKKLFHDLKQEAAVRQAHLNEENQTNEQTEVNALVLNRESLQPTQSTDDVQPAEVDEFEDDGEPGFMAGVREAQRNPWVLAGYICSFVAMGLVSLCGTLLVNYVEIVTGDDTSASQAYALNNKHLVVAIPCALFFGFFTDKYNKFKIIMFVLFCSIIADLLLILSPSPYHPMAYASMVFFGIGSSGFMTFVSQVLSKYPNPKYRASVAAVGGLCSMMGQGVVSILGMYLSPITPLMPFYLFLGCASIGFVLLVILYATKKHILNSI